MTGFQPSDRQQIEASYTDSVRRQEAGLCPVRDPRRWFSDEALARGEALSTHRGSGSYLTPR